MEKRKGRGESQGIPHLGVLQKERGSEEEGNQVGGGFSGQSDSEERAASGGAARLFLLGPWDAGDASVYVVRTAKPNVPRS